MVGIVITAIFAILIMIVLVWSIIDNELSTGLTIAGLTVVLWFLFMAFVSLVVSVGAEDGKRIEYGEPTSFSKVSVSNENYIFEFDDRDPASYEDSNVKFAPPSDEASIREGTAYASWGHWLPFDDWEIGKYVEYTPSNK